MARRKFGGKYYHESMIRYNKLDAESAARRVRERGGMARITKTKSRTGFIYTIWARG